MAIGADTAATSAARPPGAMPAAAPATGGREPHIVVSNLDMAYGDFVIQRNLNFTIYHGDIFIIMGGSGCGKSTLLKHLVGLKAPARGEVLFGKQDLWKAAPERRDAILRK